MHYHDQRTVEWGHWGLTFMDPQPNAAANYGKIVGSVAFGVGNAGPVDGTIGSPLRQKYQAMCKAWIENRDIPEGFVPAK